MRHELMTWLRRGSVESLLLVLAALAGLLLSFRLRDTAHAAAAIPLVAAGIVQVILGAPVLARTPRWRRELALRLVQDPAAYRAEEMARMEAAMKGLRVRRAVEAAALAAGLLILLFLRGQASWLAVGAALATEGALMLVLGMLATLRGRAYVEALRRFLDPRAPVTGETDLGE